ncbi:MAG: hypothetical protein M1827_001554 [Pycnora praestabilis]|nr:MAG: hypothetical protein M1827_001554 [Pycnora praestabilis]
MAYSETMVDCEIMTDIHITTSIAIIANGEGTADTAIMENRAPPQTGGMTTGQTADEDMRVVQQAMALTTMETMVTIPLMTLTTASLDHPGIGLVAVDFPRMILRSIPVPVVDIAGASMARTLERTAWAKSLIRHVVESIVMAEVDAGENIVVQTSWTMTLERMESEHVLDDMGIEELIMAVEATMVRTWVMTALATTALATTASEVVALEMAALVQTALKTMTRAKTPSPKVLLGRVPDTLGIMQVDLAHQVVEDLTLGLESHQNLRILERLGRIMSAFKKRRVETHPDKHTEEIAKDPAAKKNWEAEFHAVTKAKETLINPPNPEQMRQPPPRGYRY